MLIHLLIICDCFQATEVALSNCDRICLGIKAEKNLLSIPGLHSPYTRVEII